MKKIFLFLILISLFSGCIQSQPTFEKAKNINNVSITKESFVANVSRNVENQTIKKEFIQIKKITSAPKKWDGKIVIIKGVAYPGLALEYVDEQPYLIKDETGEIWVITKGLPPATQSSVIVKGKVVVPYQIKGFHYDVAVLEIERRVAEE